MTEVLSGCAVRAAIQRMKDELWNDAQIEALNELAHASGWIKTRWLSGSGSARSQRNLHSLVEAGLIESRRYGDNRQSQYQWRITPAGRAALAKLRGRH
jgi:hypothetical protein